MSTNKMEENWVEKERKKQKRSSEREPAVFVESWKNIESWKNLRETEIGCTCDKCGNRNPSFGYKCTVCGSILLPNL